MSKKQVYADATIEICATAANANLDQTAYEALTWVQANACGNVGEWSTEDNILSYDTLDENVTTKVKGVKNAGSPVVEFAYLPDDAGQAVFRTAGKSTDDYAFKVTLNDGTIRYSRGIVSGPMRPGGGREDFVLHRFNLGLNQEVLEVQPA